MTLDARLASSVNPTTKEKESLTTNSPIFFLILYAPLWSLGYTGPASLWRQSLFLWFTHSLPHTTLNSHHHHLNLIIMALSYISRPPTHDLTILGSVHQTYGHSTIFEHPTPNPPTTLRCATKFRFHTDRNVCEPKLRFAPNNSMHAMIPLFSLFPRVNRCCRVL